MNSTPHQRLHIRTLLRDLDLPTEWVAVAHLPYFAAAGVAPQAGADSLDGALRNLTREQADRFAKALQAQGTPLTSTGEP